MEVSEKTDKSELRVVGNSTVFDVVFGTTDANNSYEVVKLCGDVANTAISSGVIPDVGSTEILLDYTVDDISTTLEIPETVDKVIIPVKHTAFVQHLFNEKIVPLYDGLGVVHSGAVYRVPCVCAQYALGYLIGRFQLESAGSDFTVLIEDCVDKTGEFDMDRAAKVVDSWSNALCRGRV